MKRFHYRLNKVLEVKKILEKKRAKELADAIKAFNRQQDSLNRLRAQREGLFEEMKTRISGVLSLHELTAYYSYIGRLTYEMFQQRSRLEELRRRVDDQRDRYFAANREKQILERLKERKYVDYLYEIGREEQSFLDEIANQRALIQNQSQP